MVPLHRDPHFTFRFADDRIVPRFHLEGVGAGRRVDVFRIDPATGERLGMLTTGLTGEGGWVDVKESIIVRAGDAFVAVLDSNRPEESNGQVTIEDAPGDVNRGFAGVSGRCGVSRQPGATLT
jgi:hypothetical protein